MHEQPPTTFADILGLWRNPTVLARDLGVKLSTPHQWRRRNFIHPKYWPVLIDAARRVHGVEITLDQLMAATATAAKKRRRCKAARKAAATRRANREQQADAETSGVAA